MSESESPTGPQQQTPSRTTPQTAGSKPETTATPPTDPTQGQPPTPQTPSKTAGEPKPESQKPCPDPEPGPKPDPYIPEPVKCDEIKIVCDPPTTGADPQTQLEQLEAKLKADKALAVAVAQEAEKRKVLVADLTQRVASMQKTVSDLKKTNDDYAEKYNKIYGDKRKIECWVAATRGQLDLPLEAQKCVDAEVNKVTQRIADAKGFLVCQQQLVDAIEKRYKEASDVLTAARKKYEFLKIGLLEGVSKKVDELGKLQPAEPGKDSCLTYVFLNEMDTLLSNEADPKLGGADCAKFEELQIGTFLCCWPPEKYKTAYEAALVEVNNAEYVEKCLKADLEAEKKKLPDLDKAWKESKDKRRDWIVARVKEAKCCETQPIAPAVAAPA